MTDDIDPQTGESFDVGWREAPLPPIGSFEADLIRPRLGHIKLGVIHGDLWMWPEIGEPELIPWTDISLVGQRGSLVKLDWGPSEALFEFPSNTVALEFSALVEDNQVAPPRETAQTPEHTSPSTTEAVGRHDQVDKPAESLGARPRSRPQRAVRTVLKTVLALMLIGLVAVLGVLAGQRFIGEGPSQSTGPRPVVIREASGEGDQVLAAFVADGPWKVLWTNEGSGPFSVTAVDSSGESHDLVEAASSGEDSVFSELDGSISIEIEGEGPWRVAVVERDPAALEDAGTG